MIRYCMSSGALTLTEYPSTTVNLSCDKCGRVGQYRKSTLIDKYGGVVRLPNLLKLIAADCGRVGAPGNDPCGARYVGLVGNGRR